MKKLLFLSILLSPLSQLTAQQNDQYQFSVDLTKCVDDRLTIDLITPAMKKDTVLYRMPAMVPGTYKVYNFGKFAKDLKAYDHSGKEMVVNKLDVNTWQIVNAKQLEKIEYSVEDTWDAETRGERVFEPAGTNFEADTNFVINTHGLFGYFDGMKKTTYVVKFKHPSYFYGSTAYTNAIHTSDVDTYTIPDYMQLVDGPIMYDRPDTAHVLIGGADVLISVYSPNKLVSAKFVADSLRILLDLQRQYLGGTLPIKNYAFIIYLTDDPNGFKSGSFGALEHSYSSMYTLLEQKPADIAQTVKDVSAHEFFHVVTPLSIHSTQIGDFDYNNPQMSEHLWMYEGLTEYAAHHVQVKYGTLSLDDYLLEIHDEMVRASNYQDNLSFTEMSKGCLDKYEDQYNNVYAKGALIGLCLDIRLRELSDGKYGTQDMMHDLSKLYGKDKSFNDDSLFADIVRLTYPEIGDFFKKYVIGGEPLPLEEYLNNVGILYQERATVQVIDPFGGYGLRLDTDGKIRMYPGNVNDFGREMGYQKGDIFVSVNGIKITPQNGNDVLTAYIALAEAGDKITVVVQRANAKGKLKTVKLKGTLHTVGVIKKNVLSVNTDATQAQLRLRKAWINK
ncbi:MAG TPA: peptidase M61 [Bacteroidia bacterium]|jgi:predicted metalloprotease with PDZ domain|nr:peptidase M61 [Bacteroidia bacterium]